MNEVDDSFWKRCVDAWCVVIPVRIYSQYGKDGNISEEYSEGIKFIALNSDGNAVAPDYWFMIDEQNTELKNYHDSPEAALKAFEEARKGTK